MISMPVIVAASHVHAQTVAEQSGWEVQQSGLRYRNLKNEIVNYIHEGQELKGFPRGTKIYLGWMWERRKDFNMINRLIDAGVFKETIFEE